MDMERNKKVNENNEEANGKTIYKIGKKTWRNGSNMHICISYTYYSIEIIQWCQWNDPTIQNSGLGWSWYRHHFTTGHHVGCLKKWVKHGPSESMLYGSLVFHKPTCRLVWQWVNIHLSFKTNTTVLNIHLPIKSRNSPCIGPLNSLV